MKKYTRVDTPDPLISYSQPINDSLTFTVKPDGSVGVIGIQDGFPAKKIWVNSGGGYKNVYDYDDGNLFWLGPVLGDTKVVVPYDK